MKYIKVFKEEQMVNMEKKGFSAMVVEAALDKFMNHPNLMRRLINLKKTGSELTKKIYNPCYSEMISADITEDYVDVVEIYLHYSDGKRLEELADYKHSGRGVFCASKTSRVMLPCNNYIAF